jgi:alpha-galactosidase
MKKFAFIGAGSFEFTRKLVRDILTFPAFRDCHIALMDIDAERLDASRRAVERIVEATGFPVKVTASRNRREALTDADGVLLTILAGGVSVWRYDVEVPKKFGVDINVGDTRGPSGIFRALRTIPVMRGILSDIEQLCPHAVVLNYTNPMSMLCRAMQEQTAVSVTGLCHSVQGTAEMLARWIDVPMKDVSYRCAGINHQAWYLQFRCNGEDAYPRIRQAIRDRPEVYNEELVRNEMFLHLDYYVTESSGHNSEYVAWFRKRPDLLEKYCTHGTGWNPGAHAYILNEYRRREGEWRKDIESWLAEPAVDLSRGSEYAAPIFNAVFGDNAAFEFNGNVRNNGLIDNLPPGCCVEVPLFASKRGLDPVHVGPLPDHLAIINNVNARIEELAVQASFEGDPRKVFHAICMDPLTSAVLSLEEIKAMTGELFERNREWLPQFRLAT